MSRSAPFVHAGLFLLCLLVAFPAAAQIHVKADAAGANDGSSWVNAFVDLQDALGAATSGDEIWVAAGTYKPTSGTDRAISFVLPSGVPLYGGFAGTESMVSERNIADNPTILSGDLGGPLNVDNSYRVVQGSSSVMFDGFIVMGGNANGGGSQSQTGGMSGDGTISNVMFINNSGNSEGGALFTSNVVLTNVTFIGNTSSRGGGVYIRFGGNTTIVNAVFIGNVATVQGGAIYHAESGNTTITNATFVGNGSVGSSSLYNRRSNVTLTNVIIANEANPIGNYPSLTVTTISYSLIDGSGGSGAGWDPGLGIDGGNNIDADPLLLDPDGADVRLTMNSPAVDAGDNGAPSLPPADITGNPRIENGTVDMGAFEFACAVGTQIYVDADAPAGGDGSSWPNAHASLTHALAADCGTIDEMWVAEGTYTPSAGSGSEVTFQLRSGLALYGGFAGSETLLGERDAEAHPTILSGDLTAEAHSLHVVTATNTDGTAILDGFTVTGGSSADGGGGLLNIDGSPTVTDVIFDSNIAFEDGGGIYNSNGSPTLTGVTFSGNSASTGSGGGMYNFIGAPVLTDVVFENNSALANGGGMFNTASNPSITDATFIGNTALAGGGAIYNNSSSPTLANVIVAGNTALNGGGMYNFLNSNPTLTNATFEGNSTTVGNGGAFYNAASAPVIVNTIVWNNAATVGAQIYNSSGTPAISYSLVEGSGGSGGGWDPSLGTDGGNNIDADPLFQDAVGGNLRLTAGSPAIDAGNNSAPNLPLTDIDGNPRIIGVAVDMGAYEFDPVTSIDDGDVVPKTAAIQSVYPNPFNPTVTVAYELNRARIVDVSIYNVKGQIVRRLVNGVETAGLHRATWDATDDSGVPVASGVYLIQIESEGWRSHRKVTLLK